MVLGIRADGLFGETSKSKLVVVASLVLLSDCILDNYNATIFSATTASSSTTTASRITSSTSRVPSSSAATTRMDIAVVHRFSGKYSNIISKPDCFAHVKTLIVMVRRTAVTMILTRRGRSSISSSTNIDTFTVRLTSFAITHIDDIAMVYPNSIIMNHFGGTVTVVALMRQRHRAMCSSTVIVVDTSTVRLIYQYIVPVLCCSG